MDVSAKREDIPIIQTCARMGISDSMYNTYEPFYVAPGYEFSILYDFHFATNEVPAT